MLHHCKRSQGPLQKRLPVGAGLAPDSTNGLIGRSALHSRVLQTALMFLSQGTMNSSQDSWWIFLDIQHCYQNMFNHYSYWELPTDFFPPAVTVHRLKLFWGFLDVFAPSLFSRSCPDWRSKTLQHVSIWEQPTISPSVTTALSNIFFSLLVLLMPLQSLPSGILQMAQQCSAVKYTPWDTCICGVSKSLLPPRFFLLSMMVPRGLKKPPRAAYSASMVTRYQM